MEAFCPYGSDSYEGRNFEVRCGINTLEEQLEGKKFYQVPSLYIVGLAYTARIKKELLLDDGTSVPVSRRLFRR